jgi:predicted O-methyltransferase YrrM
MKKPSNQPLSQSSRLLSFASRQSNRYWWYRLEDCQYLPPIYAQLTDQEQEILADWFDDTEKQFASPGEISVPAMSFLNGIIGGNGITAVVQCGHYVGYSTLLLGFLFRKMGKKKALFSIDLDPDATAYTMPWLDRAGLLEYVTVVVGDSADAGMVSAAAAYHHGRRPQLILIDSSHQYRHTIKELTLWYPQLQAGGFVVMHDTSTFAAEFDSTNTGGVQRALLEWCEHQQTRALLLNATVDTQPPSSLTYRDGCGLGIIQKPV